MSYSPLTVIVNLESLEKRLQFSSPSIVTVPTSTGLLSASGSTITASPTYLAPVQAATKVASGKEAQPNISPLPASVSVGNTYTVPPTPTVTLNEDPGWKFKLNPSGSPQSTTYDDTSWTSVALPYTWNGTDAASTSVSGSNGWYRKIITLDPSAAGKRLYLQFGAGALVTSLYIDGKQIDLNPATTAVDTHKGAFQAFEFDVTDALNAAIPTGLSGHLLAVNTNNATNVDVAPAGSGDYSKQGGLYRDVSLIAVNPSHIALTESVAHPGVASDTPSLIADSGIRFSNSTVEIGATSANLAITTIIDNLQAARSVVVTSYVVDASGIVQALQSTTLALTASQAGASAAQATTIANPHLWDGRIDPYLYDLYVEVRDSATNELLDLGHQQVGIRSFKINANPDPNSSDPSNRAAFMLNGHPYRIVGVDAHQDSGRLNANGNPVGWAQTTAQIHADLDLIADMGATAIRTSHYQDSPAFYSYCDQLGLMVYTESPINGTATNSTAFLSNAEDQYQELIRQNFNHPSIFAWGFGNETSGSSTLLNIFNQFKTISHGIDSTRLTGFATYGGSTSSSTNADGVSDIKGTHPYDYWYGPSDVKATHNAYPTQPLGVTEYGGGGSAYQYADSFTLPVSQETGGVTTHYHPANQQTRLEELQYTDLTQLNFLWGQFTWQMFDHGSSGKNEGDQGGVNDKGLVTRDRVPKDSYYFYQAALNDPSRTWDNKKVLYISDRFWTARNTSTATVTVFSNIGAPTLSLNGVSLGSMSPLVLASGPNSLVPGTNETLAATYVMNVTLAAGSNSLAVSDTYSDGQTYKDSAVWTYRNSLSGLPTARIDFVPSGAAAAAGYSADNGSTYSQHGAQTYGWVPATGSASAFGSVLNVGGTFGAASADPSQNGINLAYDPVYKNSSIWEYALRNGTYDVRIGAGQAGTSDGINMFTLEGKTAAIDSNGNNSQDTFFARVTVTDGKLTLGAAAGAYNTRIDYIDINLVSITADGTPLKYYAVKTFIPIEGNTPSAEMQFSASAANKADFTQLTELPTGVHSRKAVNSKFTGAVASPSAFSFHHLFGDVNGDRTADAQDALFSGFSKVLFTDSVNYRSVFDLDWDGDINALGRHHISDDAE